MMGTLATVLAGMKIPTFGDRFRADVEGDVEVVGGVLKITEIRVRYTLQHALEISRCLAQPAWTEDRERGEFPHPGPGKNGEFFLTREHSVLICVLHAWM